MKDDLAAALLESHQQKMWHKAQKKKHKQEAKAAKAKAKQGDIATPDKPRVWVIDFKGSMDAHEVNALREEVTAVLAVAKPGDRAVVRLESPGGVVHGYGLAASQLQRLRDKNIPLTVTVDKVAASGGYMMACVAEKIIAAPFAIVGRSVLSRKFRTLTVFSKAKTLILSCIPQDSINVL
ncbi:putative protease sohB [Salmonella bongori]|nr:putative protease sohB [Salmonella bongori]